MFLGRQVLDHLVARKTALSLLLGQLVNLMQLLNNPLLLDRRKVAEVGITAQSTLGKGATFIVTLPLLQVTGETHEQ